ncbi:MAG: O-antigen ligase family protein [Sedimentisphaerales bacterium]|nr:O-antigen ligase family protein [Sedimentisphaerales bacterium]
MGDINLDFEGLGSASSRFDNVIGWLLGGLLLVMPFAFGVVHAWSEEIVIILSGAIVICFLLKVLCCPSQNIIWSWGYVPIALFLFIIIFQLVPLPVGLVKVISPNTAALRTELLSDLPDANNSLKWMTLSLYPYATWHDLRLVMSLAAIFFVVLNIYRKVGQIKNLLMIIALIGGSVAFITLGQQVFGNGKIYWLISSKNTSGNSGPFVCHSHYGQFINLSIGAALGWLCVTVGERFSRKKLRPDEILNYLSSPPALRFWILIAIISIGAGTVFISLTRGGMISMLAAAAFTTLLLVSRKSLASSGWIMVLMALAAFACILYVGFDAVYDRFASLGDLNEYQNRLQIIKDLTSSFGKFPVFGTGLGTHSTVYPMFQTINTSLIFTHAENEYAQVIEETGFVGLVVLIIFGIFVWQGYFRNVRRGKSHINFAAYGLGFGLFAVLIHSLSDFGQHLPANAFLSVIFCALLLGLVKRQQEKGTKPEAAVIKQRPKIFVTIVLLFVCGVWLWAFVGSNNARIAESYWNKAIAIEKGLIEKDWQGTEGEYEDLIACAASGVEYQPLNAKYRYWLNVYRWYSITKTVTPDPEEDTIIPQESLPLAQTIVKELNKSIVLCPTFGPLYSLVGRIEMYVFYDDAGAEGIRKGFQLASCDAIACLEAARLDVLEGRVEDAIVKFQKAVAIEGSLFREVVDIYVHYLSRPDLAIAAAGEDFNRLSYVAGVLNEMQYYDLEKQVHEKIKTILEIRCQKHIAGGWDYACLAGIYRSQHDDEKAIECYRRALSFNYGDIHWRFALAQLLADNGRIPDALQQARICVRLRPQHASAKQLIEQLSVDPASFTKKAN